MKRDRRVGNSHSAKFAHREIPQLERELRAVPIHKEFSEIYSTHLVRDYLVETLSKRRPSISTIEEYPFLYIVI